MTSDIHQDFCIVGVVFSRAIHWGRILQILSCSLCEVCIASKRLLLFGIAAIQIFPCCHNFIYINCFPWVLSKVHTYYKVGSVSSNACQIKMTSEYKSTYKQYIYRVCIEKTCNYSKKKKASSIIFLITKSKLIKSSIFDHFLHCCLIKVETSSKNMYLY